MAEAEFPNEDVNILLVDDKPGNLLALSAILKRPGYNLVTANSGPEALECIAKQNFGVVLLDVMMPQMDGFELASLIKENEQSRNLPIIFLTAAAHDFTYIYKAYAIGGVDYLQKPLDADVVRAKVEVFVELYRKTMRIKYQADLLRESERREQEYRLAEVKQRSEERYRKLADAIPHIVWIATADGKVEYFNQRWFQYTGLDFEQSDAWGHKHAVIHTEDEARFVEQLQGAITSRASHLEVECRLRRAQDEEYRWHLCRVLPEQSSQGEILAWLGTFTDIDVQKRAEQELMLMREAAESANKAKSDFLAVMSHEIRTPLGAIAGFTDLILDPESAPKERLEWVGTIKRNCQHLFRLINEILDLSKIEAGQLEIDRVKVSLPDVVFEVQSLLSPLASAKGLQLEIEMPETISTVTTDPGRLKQILINVIGNAIKFTTKGGVKVNVATAGAGNQANLVFVIKDTGPGLTREQADRLFQPFAQADKSTSRKYGGTGLGLALSRRLALALGGDLVLSDCLPGKGCTFTLTVDISAADVADSTPQPIPLKKVSGKRVVGSQLSGKRVLLVEDTIDNQILVRKFLELAGANVDLAQNGDEGVDFALKGDHDLVLMDVQMPGLDGYQAASALRGQGYVKPIIALTAHVMKGEKERCIKAGYSDYLSKPIDRLKLVETIEHYTKASAGVPVVKNVGVSRLIGN